MVGLKSLPRDEAEDLLSQTFVYLRQWFNDDAKEQFKMDFKKCSEVYGYKSIAEVEEEELEAKILATKLEMVDAMFANDIPIEKIAVISGLPLEEIQKRRSPACNEKF